MELISNRKTQASTTVLHACIILRYCKFELFNFKMNAPTVYDMIFLKISPNRVGPTTNNMINIGKVGDILYTTGAFILEKVGSISAEEGPHKCQEETFFLIKADIVALSGK